MNNNKQIDLFFLEEFLNELILYRKDKKNIIIKLGKIDSKNEYNTYFLIPNNQYLKRIILCFEDIALKSITIFADFDFDFKALINRYGSYREHYSPYDDIYLYFFNENNDFPFYIECERSTRYDDNDIDKNLIKKIKILLKNDDKYYLN